MKKFEVPYNFDNDFIIEISKRQEYFPFIKFIYMPAFKEQNILNTREWCCVLNKENYSDYNLYKKNIKEIQNLNLDVAILIQNGATLELIDKYVNEFNIKYFIINDDNLAKQIKEKYNNIYLILSITRILTYQEILQNDLSMYDEIVLFFWFNRHLDFIKRLPSKYKYSILANCFCYYGCKNVKTHWYKYRGTNISYCNLTEDESDNKNIYIKPRDLIYFDKYVNSFKLLDRIDDTKTIMNTLENYINNYRNLELFEFNKEQEDYYNIKD